MRTLIFFILTLFATAVFARDAAQVRLFRKTHECPATHKFMGACPGWVVDHAWPLCAGGPDEPSNMVWQSKADSYKKDVLERKACREIKSCK